MRVSLTGRARRGGALRLVVGALMLAPLVLRLVDADAAGGSGAPTVHTKPPPLRGGWRVPRPFEGQYGITLTSAILALAPFIVITTAYALFTEQVGQALHIDRTGLEIIAGLSTAGYAWGALFGGDIVQRLPQRPLFLVCEALFVVGCLLSAVAPGAVTYGAGRVLSGLATGLLLVVALPPVIQKFPAAKMPITVVAVNIGFFGAVCIGPLLGGWVAAGHHWRWFFGGLAALTFAKSLLAALTLPDQKPQNPGMRFDWPALVLALGGTVLPFWAVGLLSRHGFASAWFAAPLFVGLLCFVGLLLLEYHHRDPLSPVQPMWTTLSVVGTLVAMVAGAVFVTFLELGERFQMQVQHQSPLQTGILFWPLAVGVVITAALFGAILRTRFIPVLILAGMAALMGGGGMLLAAVPGGGGGITLGAAGLLGLGAGATVSPGLYLAGFPLPVKIIGRIFALIELVRSLADYLLAPVMLRIAEAASGGVLNPHGIALALWITVLVSIVLTGFGVFLYVGGGAGLAAPDLEKWLSKAGSAMESPRLLARLRRCSDRQRD